MFFRKSVDKCNTERLAALEETTAALRRDLSAAREDLDVLTDKFVRLRGKVYAHKLHLAEDEAGPRRETKADILRRVFTPGKPVNHQQE